MMAPIGTNTNAIRFLTSCSGAPQAERGSMASRKGSPNEAPRPWSTVRRESGFMETLVLMTSRLLRAPQLERRGFNDPQDQRLEPVVSVQASDDLVHGAFVEPLDAAPQGVG